MMSGKLLAFFIVLLHQGLEAFGTVYGNVNIDLNLGIVTGYSDQVQFIVAPTSKLSVKECSYQAVVKLLLNGQKTSVVHIDLKYNNPRLWSFHMSDSNVAEGYDFTTGNVSSVSQVQIINEQLRIYNEWPSPYSHTKYELSGIGTAYSQWMWLTIVDTSLRKSSQAELSLQIEENMFRWHDGLLAQHIAAPPGLFYKGGKAKNNTVLYIAMNRAISAQWRNGTGLCQVKIRFKDASDGCNISAMKCDSNAECKPARKSFRCACQKGWEGNGKKCKDIDECHVRNGGCVHLCNNLPGSYSCSCLPGFKTDPYDPYNCIDINECETNNGGCEDKCINTIGSYKCTCVINNSVVTSLHKDCSIQYSACIRYGCEHSCKPNVDGKMTCICKEGYHLNTTDNQSCIRSCRIGNGGCQHHCYDTDSGVVCTCQHSYLLGHDSSTCTASCSVNNGGCQKRCANTDVGVVCSCPSGYILNEDGKSCSDTDECTVDNGKCEYKCVNSIGSYECICPKGYKLNASDEHTCVDIDECNTNRTCDHACVNTPGSYYCMCDEGYQLYGVKHCGDVDECAFNNGGCEEICINTNGGFLCTSYRNFSQIMKDKCIDNKKQPIASVRLIFSGVNCSENNTVQISNKLISFISHRLFSKCFLHARKIKCLHSKKAFKKYDGNVVRLIADVMCTQKHETKYNISKEHENALKVLAAFNKKLSQSNNTNTFRIQNKLISVIGSSIKIIDGLGMDSRRSTPWSADSESDSIMNEVKCDEELFNVKKFQNYSSCPNREFLIGHCKPGEFWNGISCSCELCPEHTYQHELGKDFCIPCPGGTETDKNGRSDVNDCKNRRCGGSISGLQGYIESPNYPGNYPSNVDCIWKFKSPKGRRVLFIASDINIADDKCGDILVIRKSKSPNSILTFEACKSLKKPIAFVAESKRLWIQFKSDSNNSSKGFYIPFVTYNEEYHTLIEDIVQDSRLYASQNHLEILRDQKLLDDLMEVIIQPVNYYKYANDQRKMFPSTFIKLLTPKVKKFFSR